MKEDQKLLTIASFEDAVDAEEARAVLEDAGIQAVVIGESLGGGYPLSTSSRTDFIELRVFEEDADQAEKILVEYFGDEDGDGDFDEDDFEEGSTDDA